jgi:hypothetical protein
MNEYGWWVGWFMVFNATFNNISVISWRSGLFVEENGVPREHLLINLTRKQTSDIHKHEQKAVIENVEAVMDYRIYSRFITTICMIE